MMSWSNFYIFALSAIALSMVGAVVALCHVQKSRGAIALTLLAVLVQAVFIVGLWMTLERPPLRTMGETRLWYSFFVLAVGLLVYVRWGFRWLLLLTGTLSMVFNIINMVHPEIHDQTLMPALQSIWFIPHVTIYMLAYAILACATLLAIVALIRHSHEYLTSIDDLVYIGTGMIFLGLLMGSIWGKQAWGDFWNWDPKETWAAITCAGYLSYIHLRFTRAARSPWVYVMVIVSFVLLQMCWYGYQYLPSAQESMHMYNIQ